MKKSNVISRVGALLLLLVLVAPLLIGCGAQVAADTATGEVALDAKSQLALGTLQLEGTADAVTEAQATALLPLWQMLGGGDLQGESEQYAVLKQIEAAMTADQVSAIAGLRLTQQDAQDWMEAQGSAASTGEAQTTGARQKPEGLEEMTDEEREQMREQMQSASEGSAQMGDASFGNATGAFGGGQSMALTRAVVELLTVQSGAADEAATQPPVGQAVEQATGRESTSAPESPAMEESSTETESAPAAEDAAATESPEAAEDTAAADDTAAEQEGVQGTESSPAKETKSVVYVVQAGNSLAAIAAAYGVTVEAIVEANEIVDPNTIYAGQALVIVEPGRIPEPDTLASSVQAQSETTMVVAAPAAQALEWLPDSNPGPPLTIEVSANRATQDPLVEQSQTYLVTGIVRNDGDQTYAVSGIGVTFYDAEGFRGTFDPAIRDGKVVGGEWNWHGQTEAEFAAFLLAPGEEWPFSVAMTAQDMASFLIHPDATATGRESASVELSDVTVVDPGTGYVRISGTATNANAFKIKNVTVSGALLDVDGQIVSMGSVYVLQEDIESGESVHFDVHVEMEPFVRYQLYAQAERDWH